jgi:hypothetical protein
MCVLFATILPPPGIGLWSTGGTQYNSPLAVVRSPARVGR